MLLRRSPLPPSSACKSYALWLLAGCYALLIWIQAFMAQDGFHILLCGEHTYITARHIGMSLNQCFEYAHKTIWNNMFLYGYIYIYFHGTRRFSYIVVWSTQIHNCKTPWYILESAFWACSKDNVTLTHLSHRPRCADKGLSCADFRTLVEPLEPKWLPR